MRDFTLPFKPEELLAQPADGRLWAQDLPNVEDWNSEDLAGHLDSLVGRLLSSNGHDLAEDKSFSLVFALIQAWPRLDEGVRPRVADLLADAARRLIAEVARIKSGEKKGKSTKKKQTEEDSNAQQLAFCHEARNAVKVAAFFLRWAIEKLLKLEKEEMAGTRRRGKGGGKGSKKDEDQAAAADEEKEKLKAADRQRCSLLSELLDLLVKGPMPWLWVSDEAGWQSVAQSVSDAGFAVLEMEQALKHRETRQLALRLVADPLSQEGHQHSNLLVATVSKLMHALRGHELVPAFAAEAMLLAHATPLPRHFLVELTQHCTPQELTAAGGLQRAMGSFLSAISERLPHVVLANISVLLPMLDVDCYPLRSAIVESIGHLLSAEGKALPKGARCSAIAVDETQGEEGAEKPEQPTADKLGSKFVIAAATKKDLLETLAARATDKTVWVRVKSLQTLNSLAGNTRVAALPRELWTKILEIATKRMQDVASSARKAAIQLCRTLIELHPYGPAIKGSGDERAKAENVMKEINGRVKQLREEDLKAEAAANGVDIEVDLEDDDDAEAQDNENENDSSQVTESQAKKRRFTKKTVTEKTATCEVFKCMEEAAEGLEAAADQRKGQLEALKRMADCYSQRVRFVELIDSAEERLRALLVSKTATDVTESINVVVELRLKGLPAATQAFNQVLGLVWSRNQAIKDCAVEAFHKMHLDGRNVQAAVQSLLEMYRDGSRTWTYTHLASVQELIQEAARQEYIDPKVAFPVVVNGLRDAATVPMALRTLTALCASNSAALVTQLPRIVECVGPQGSTPYTSMADRLERVRLIGQLLQRLHVIHGAPMNDETWGHLVTLCEYITMVVVEHFSKADVPAEWFGAAQVAMDLCFELHGSATAKSHPILRSPDKLWEQILSRMLQGVLTTGRVAVQPSSGGPESLLVVPAGHEDGDSTSMAMDGVGGEIVPVNNEGPSNPASITVAQLGAIIYLSGHLALRMLVFLEGLQSSLKKMRLKEEDARIAAAREVKKEKAAQKKHDKATAAAKGKKGSKAPKEEEEEEEEDASTAMGQAGAEEREAEMFLEIAEQRLLYGTKSLLDRVKPLIFGGLLNPGLREEPILRRVAAISLCKYMTVSKRFCEEHLQLLFSVLFPKTNSSSILGATQEEDPAATQGGKMAVLFEDLTLRTTLLVSVGDLLFRHPNVVEPWSDRLYSALGNGGGTAQGNVELRLTALLVLTHLVLNDMLKPRSVLLVRALWLTACPHEPTARVARILFQELSKRTSSVIYNLLPMIIAGIPEHQSAAGVAGSSEDRVKFVMQFIEKEKHIEGLIEKLTVRLEQAADVAGGKASSLDVPKNAAAVGDSQMPEEEEVEDEKPQTVANCHARAMVSCLATALGAMNYSDRCILRLQDAIVVRKVLNNAISFHQVTRDNLMAIVDRSRNERKNRGGKEKVEAPPADDAKDDKGSEGPGGKGAAVTAALDAIDQLVTKLGEGKEKKDKPVEETAQEKAVEEPAGQEAGSTEQAAPAPKTGKGKGKKRAADDTAAEGAAGDKPAPRGRGRGKADKENAAQDDDNATLDSIPKEKPVKVAVVKPPKAVGGLAAEIKAAKEKLKAKKRRVDDDANVA